MASVFPGNGVSPSGTERVEQLIAQRSQRTFCPVAAEVTRTTTCRCLCDLMKCHRRELLSALSQFLDAMVDKPSVDSQRYFANKHVYTPDERPGLTLINRPKNCDYLLPLPSGRARPDSAVVLCRSSIVELTRAFLGTYWASTETVFPSTAEMGRKKRKRTIFRILSLLLMENIGPRDSVCWEQHAFRRLNMSKDTAKHHVTKYKLRQIVHQNVVRSINHHSEWVQNTFNGSVIALPPSLLEMLSVLQERGRRNSGYDTVQSESVRHDATLRPKRVQFRKIEPERSTDKASYTTVQKYIKPIVANTLGVLLNDLELMASFLRSLGYAPQAAHFDYPEHVLQKNGRGIYLGLTPLTENGAYLQVWDRNARGSPGHVVFIPFGFILMLPGDTVHGGGFHQCFQSLDLRLHLYIYVQQPGEVFNSNIYQSLDDYPMHDELREKDGLLSTIFKSDEETPRRPKNKGVL